MSRFIYFPDEKVSVNVDSFANIIVCDDDIYTRKNGTISPAVDLGFVRSDMNILYITFPDIEEAECFLLTLQNSRTWKTKLKEGR